MLQTGGHQIVHRLFVDNAIQILPPCANLGRPFNVGILIGNRQTALAVDRMFFGRIEDFGVDEHAGILDGLAVFFLLQVHHQQAFRYAYLYRGKADAGCRVHCFKHIIDQLFKIGIERFDRRRNGFQPWIGYFENW